MPSEPIWIERDVILAIHGQQLAEHGGLAGIRSPELLDAALARPQTLAAYDERADVAAIGAMYAIAIARNHPFIDGNKRVAWVAMRTFLVLNDVVLIFDPVDAVTTMLRLAADDLDDAAFTQWVRDHAAR